MTLTKEIFLKEVADHKLTVLHDDGIYRHLRVQIPNSSMMNYDIITYPGYLVYSGDMGSYTFSRLQDMLNFFRDDREEWKVNIGYWGEKLQAVDWHVGASQWSQDSFEEAVMQRLSDWLDVAEEDVYDADFISEQKSKVNDLLNESRELEAHAVAAINNWDADYNGVDFPDFWEGGMTEATHRYLWCCHAIVWAIRLYDEVKKDQVCL